MKIKTIVFDLDGTLLNSERKILQANIDAIKAIQKQGVDIILASGRGIKNIIPLAQKLAVDHVIALNGSLVYSVKQDKILFSSFLSDDIVQKGYNYCLDNKVDAIFYSFKEAYIFQDSPNYKLIDQYFKTNSVNFKIQDAPKILKIIIISIPDADKSYHHQMNLQQIFKNDNVEIQRSSIRSIDINPKGVSKLQGLKTLCQIKNIDLAYTAAFGNADNDLQMLEAVKYGYVMKNATPKLLKSGLEIIQDHNSLAIAKKINSFIIKQRG